MSEPDPNRTIPRATPAPDQTAAHVPADDTAARAADTSGPAPDDDLALPVPNGSVVIDAHFPPRSHETVARVTSDGTRPEAGRGPATADGVPGYELLGELGRGGMGVVYKARQRSLNRLVALKMILAEGADGSNTARFLAEAEVVAAVRHPNVVQVYDYGKAGGRPYMALEFCPGGSLSDRLKGGVRLAPDDAAGLVERIARGVQAAHTLGIVHRDLKPANVLFDEAGEPKVSDFGLAKRAESELTQTGAVMGTPAYMAPEQAGGLTHDIGPPADVWALGVILYECLTGGRPFVADRADELLAKVLMSEPDPLRSRAGGVPRDLDTICHKCLSKEPGERYPSALALAQDLERFRAGEPILAKPEGALRKVWRRVRRRGAVLALAAALLVAVGLAGWFVNQSSAQRRVNELTRRIDDGLAAGEWPDGHRDRLESLTHELAAVDPVQADAARRRLAERVVQRLRERLARPRVESAEVPGLEAEIAWVAARDAAVAQALDRDLRARLRRWNPVLELASPFGGATAAFPAGLVAVAGDRLARTDGPAAVPTRVPSRGALRAEVDFAPGWEDGRQFGFVVHHQPAPGAPAPPAYTFRVVPAAVAGDAPPAAGNRPPETFRGAGARAEILRGDTVLLARGVRAAPGQLRLTAERSGPLLRFRVGDEPLAEYEDAFPLGGGDGTVLAVLWPAPAGVTRLLVETQTLPPAASPLERADDLFDRGQFVEAAALYRQAGNDPATAAEALCKAGLCFAQVKRADEAVPLLEAAVAQPGDRWPVLAACQLWLTQLEAGQFEQAGVAFATASGRFTPAQLARFVPAAVREKILGYQPTTTINYFMPGPDLIKRIEARDGPVRLLGDEITAYDQRYQLLLALMVTGDQKRAREVAGEIIGTAMDITAKHLGARDTFPWAMRWYCWAHRQTGRGRDAWEATNGWLNEYPRRTSVMTDADFKHSWSPVYLERARLLADDKKWEDAEAALDEFLKSSPHGNYSFEAPAHLMKGFCRQERGDVAGAAKAWVAGSWAAYKAKVLVPGGTPPHGLDPQSLVPPGRNALMDFWMLGSLAGTLTEPDAKELAAALVRMTSQDPAAGQMVGALSLSPEVLRRAWQSPRARALARKLAFLQLPPPEHYRSYVRVAVHEKLRQDLCGGTPTDDQDEALWQAVARLGDLFFDRKLAAAQMLPLGLAWKGTAGLLGWGALEPSLPAEARGPVAYAFGLRYVKLGQPADARKLFRVAAANAAKDSPVARLAGEELAKLDPKPAPKPLPLAPPPRPAGR
jgi:tetratricopeptide (TPR) repeat protein/tRNA A-37 threonylcarbamoyl transferase component Bud32